MSAPPRMPPAQQELYARIPVEWGPMPALRGPANASALQALKKRGMYEIRFNVETRFNAETGAEWRRTPELQP